MVGVPDVGGTRIEPFRLEVVGNAQPEPTKQPEIESISADRPIYTNECFGYSLKYPDGAIIEERSVESLPSDEIPAGMSADLYQEQLQLVYPQLCVSVRFESGFISISAPPNVGGK